MSKITGPGRHVFIGALKALNRSIKTQLLINRDELEAHRFFELVAFITIVGLIILGLKSL